MKTSKFYVLMGPGAEVVGCERSAKLAHSLADGYGYSPSEYSIQLIECAVSVETVRRLLGEMGGYAVTTRNVYP